jgi:hypothetical protein
MLLNSKERFGVDFVIEKHTTNEEFIVRFYSNVLLNWKQRLMVDFIID